jgi:hypothetical protein
MKVYKLLFVLLTIIIQSCSGQIEKINGVSFVASRDTITEQHIAPEINVSANYAAIMPFGFIRGTESSEIIYNTNRQWFGESKPGAKQYIESLKKKDIKIMMKPQIWISRGEFTGYLKMTDETGWKALESSYSKFILDFAQLAEDTKSEILCIGTELEQFVMNRPEYWNSLILEIKKVYKGKLTYAANWDEFKRTPFWKALDFIGVDAYFPVSDVKTPSIEECIAGWLKHKAVISGISTKYNKPILFTEFGYRSVDFTGKEPWQSDRNMGDVNLVAQTNATQALFDSFWNENWFAGGFIWKWFHKHDKVGGANNNMFTPQNKPVEAVIKSHYSKHK